MQGTRRPLAVLALVLVLAATAAAPALLEAQQAGGQMSVAVKEVAVRDKPSFTGKVIGALAYADRVTIQEVRGDWLRVGFAPKGIASGWVQRTALQVQEIALKAGGTAVGTTASSGEVALAGKGFSEEVEAEYRKDKKLDYDAVDRMEAFKVRPEAVADFAAQGGLAVEGGTP